MVRSFYESLYLQCHPHAIAHASLPRFLWALATLNSRAFALPRSAAPPPPRTTPEGTAGNDPPPFSPHGPPSARSLTADDAVSSLFSASEGPWQPITAGQAMALVPVAELLDHVFPNEARYEVRGGARGREWRRRKEDKQTLFLQMSEWATSGDSFPSLTKEAIVKDPSFSLFPCLSITGSYQSAPQMTTVQKYSLNLPDFVLIMKHVGSHLRCS